MTFNFSMQAIDHVVNSAAKTFYMSAGACNVPIVFRGPNGSAVSFINFVYSNIKLVYLSTFVV